MTRNRAKSVLTKAERKRMKEGTTAFHADPSQAGKNAVRAESLDSHVCRDKAVLSVPKSRRHIMNISDPSSIHAGPLAEFLGKEWRWGNPNKTIPHKAVYYASRACLGGHHPLHWVPRVHK